MKVRWLVMCMALLALSVGAFAQAPIVPDIDPDAGLQTMLSAFGNVMGVVWPYAAAFLGASIVWRFLTRTPKKVAK